MFSTKIVLKLPKVKAWLDDLDGTAGDHFCDMPIAEFKKYQEEQLNNYKCYRDSKWAGKQCVQVGDSDDEETEMFSSVVQANGGRAKLHDSQRESMTVKCLTWLMTEAQPPAISSHNAVTLAVSSS